MGTPVEKLRTEARRPRWPQPDAEIGGFKEQLAHGNLDGLRKYLQHTRATKDWEDRLYVLDSVVDQLPREALHFAVEQEKDAADLALIYTAYYSDLARKRRGQETCDQTEEAQFAGAAEAIRRAIPAVHASSKFDSEDPTSRALILRPLTTFGQLRPLQQHFFEQVIELAPDCPYAYRAMVNSLAGRWHGSHEESLAMARQGIAKASSRSDVAGTLFLAHNLVQSHLQNFDKDLAAAAKYLRDPEVGAELRAAYDRWTGAGYAPTRASGEYLKFARSWFSMSNDRERMERARSLIVAARAGARPSGAAEKHPDVPVASRPECGADEGRRCLALVSRGVDSLKAKEPGKALRAFLEAAKLVKLFQLDSTLQALVHVHVALALGEMGNKIDAPKALAEGLASADRADFSAAPTKLLQEMANALEQLDAMRAIPFIELLLETEEYRRDQILSASLLVRMGKCFNRVGLRDHAAIPLRAAVRIYRSSPAEPNLASALLDLGNALRASAPAEAEALYLEAAGIHERQMKLVSATPAWTNLAILCSEQGRHEEALELHAKVLNIREKFPGTSALAIARCLNNFAGANRRLGRFVEAHAAIDKSIRMIAPSEPAMAAFYGTRGEIYFDEAKFGSALEWTRKAIEARENQTSPDKDALGRNYQTEIATLEALGRTEEAARSRARLAELRATIQSTPEPGMIPSFSPESMGGAVFLELPFGASTSTPKMRESVASLTGTLKAKLREAACGRFGSKVTVPESTTLILHGSDAELIYAAVSPIVNAERICAGARVLIQQNRRVREEMVGFARRSIN